MPQLIEYNGEVIEFPDNMSSADIEQALSTLDMGGPSVDSELSTVKTTAEKEDDYNWLQRNLDFPAGIAGAVAGAKVGAPFGPAGATVGAVLGGAAGTFGGVLASQELTESELDYSKAVEAAVINMGIDVATLGAGKFIPNEAWIAAQKALGLSPTEVADKIVSKAFSEESLQKTQQMLAENGATLTPFQTGKASGSQRLAEMIAEVGMVSRGVMADNAARVNRVIQDEFQRVFNMNQGVSSGEVGQQLEGVISAGKDALGDLYDQGLTKVQTMLPSRATSATPLKLKLTKLLESKNIMVNAMDPETNTLIRRVADSGFTETTQKFINEELSKLQNVVSIDGRALISLEKKITQMQRQLGTQGGALYNPEAASELKFISGQLKDVYAEMLSKIDTNAADLYKKTKVDYAKGMESLLPEINKNVVKNASQKGAFEGLGNVVMSQGNASQVKALLRSVDEAYGLAARNGTLGDLPYKTAKEAKEALRASYLRKHMPSLLEPNADVTQYKKLARTLSTPDNVAKLKPLFGENYPRFRQLLNSIEEVAVNPQGDMGTLLFRSQEYSAWRGLGNVLVSGVGAGAGIAASGFAGAGAAILGVLYTPYVLAKMVTNPKMSNKLLALNRGNFKTLKDRTKFGALLLNDVVKEMTDMERLELGQYLQGLGSEKEQEQQQLYKSVLPQGSAMAF